MRRITFWLTFGLLAAVLLAIPPTLHAQATITVSGSKVVDNNRQPLTGQLVFTVTDTTNTPVTYTPQGGSPMTATFTLTAVKGAIQNIGGFPPTIANPATMSPANTRYRIQTQSTGGGTTYFTFPLTNITTTNFSYDGYVVPAGITISGAGIPTLNCNPSAMYNNTLASDPYPWVCSKLQGDASVYWTQNPSLNPSCQRGNDQAIASAINGTTFCIDANQAYVTPGFVWAGPLPGQNPTQIGLVPLATLCASGDCGAGIVFPTTPGIVFNTSTVSSRNGTAADVAGLFTGTGPCFLKNDGTCSNTGNVQAGPSAQIAGYNQPTTQAIVGPGSTALNYVTPILQGVKDATQFQTSPASGDGIANILATPNSYASVGPLYPNIEAAMETGPFWRVPLIFFNAEFLWSVKPPYGINTFFEDKRIGLYPSTTIPYSSIGYYAYNPLGNFSGGVQTPLIYDRINHDQESIQPGHGQNWIGHQHDQSFTGSGINQSGVWDSRTGEQWNFISTRRGISNPIVIQTQCNGDGDCHALQNDILCPGDNSTGADEGCTLYRNQMIENQVVWTAFSPSNQATGTTQILGNYIASSGLAGDGLPLIDSTQASAKCLITASNNSPVFTTAGNLVTTCTYTPDNIGHLVTDLNGSTGIVPPKYNGVTTTVTGVVVNGLSSALVPGQSTWGDSQRIESAEITAVSALSGGSQTVTVKLRYPHLVQAYVVQGPNTGKYIEAMANRKNNDANAPLRDWARVIGVLPDTHTILYAAIGAGGYQPWPQGSFSVGAFPPMTITRDGAGHASTTFSGIFNQEDNNAVININSAVNTSYNRVVQIAQIGFGAVTFRWPDSGPVGSTTTTGPSPLMTNFNNFPSGPGVEAMAYIMFPGCEVVYTGNVTTSVMDGSNLCEYNNMTVHSGDMLEVMHGNEIITNLEHNLITTWMPSSSSIASATKEEALNGIVRPGYTWNRIQVGLDRGESQFVSAGGTMRPSANWTTIFGDRMWNTFMTTPAPSAGDNPGNLWLITTCPLAGCTAQQDAYSLIHIASGHSDSKFTYSEWNATFGLNVSNLNFMSMNTSGFNYNANDGAGSNYVHNLNLSGSTLEIGNPAGSAVQVNYTASSGLVQISDGVGNASNFTQSSTKFGMDKPLTITGTADGCATFITGVLSSTGIACGSSGGIILTTTGSGGAATLVGTTLNIPVYAGGGVTSFAAPSASWPTWLVPTVTNSTTTPSLAVAASAIPNSALANPSITLGTTIVALGTTVSSAAGFNAATATLAANASAVGGVALSGLCQTGGTGCPAGTGGITGQTPGWAIEAATTTTATGPFPMDDGQTTVGFVTIHKNVQIAGTGTANGWLIPEGTAISGVALSAALYPATSTHRWMQNPNNIGALMIPGIGTAATAAHMAVFASNGIDLLDGGAVPTSGFPFTLGSTSITAGGTFTAVAGLSVNGVTLNGTGSTSLFLNQAGGYTTPSGSGTITASPKFQLPFYSATGTANTLTGDPGITTDGAGNLTVVSVTTAPVGGLGGMFTLPEGTVVTAAAGKDICYADSTAHGILCAYNGGSFLPLVTTTATQILTNKTLDGVTPATMAFLDATSSVQTQLNGKQASGTYVTAVSVTTANGISGSSSGGATPALTLTLGAITPTSTNGVSAATMAFVDFTSSGQTQLTGKAPIASPTFTGTVTVPSGAALGTPASEVLTNATGLPTAGLVANAVNSSKLAVVNTYQVCDIPIGDTSGTVIANAQLGPQSRVCFIPAAATIVEMDVNADGGTPNIIIGRNHAGTIVNIVSAALATAASGGIACSKTTAVTGLNGATTCSATLQNTSLSAGDYLELVSGTAGGTAKFMVAHVIYTVN